MIINTLDGQSITVHIQLFKQFSSKQINDELKKVQISSNSLKKLIDFLEELSHSQASVIPKPIPNPKFETFLNEVESTFLRGITALERQEILKFANDLGLNHVCNLMFTSFASELIGSTTEEFKKKNNIKIDYTPELEKEIQKHYDQLIKRN